MRAGQRATRVTGEFLAHESDITSFSKRVIRFSLLACMPVQLLCVEPTCMPVV